MKQEIQTAKTLQEVMDVVQEWEKMYINSRELKYFTVSKILPNRYNDIYMIYLNYKTI